MMLATPRACSCGAYVASFAVLSASIVSCSDQLGGCEVTETCAREDASADVNGEASANGLGGMAGSAGQVGAGGGVGGASAGNAGMAGAAAGLCGASRGGGARRGDA